MLLLFITCYQFNCDTTNYGYKLCPKSAAYIKKTTVNLYGVEISRSTSILETRQ